jgi:hypothetical protein
MEVNQNRFPFYRAGLQGLCANVRTPVSQVWETVCARLPFSDIAEITFSYSESLIIWQHLNYLTDRYAAMSTLSWIVRLYLEVGIAPEVRCHTWYE